MKNYQGMLSEFNDREIIMKALPACLYVESVRGCPYSCAMCSEHYTKPQKIADDLLKKLEPYFKDLEVLGVHGEGEPLLGDVEYFVKQSIKHNFVLHMNTTGFFLTKEIADILSKTRLSIRFSIHAGRDETYKRIMGHKFEKILENISYLVQKTKENKKRSDLWFSFIVMKENLDEIEDFLHLTYEMGIKHIRFMGLMPKRASLKGIKMRDREFEFNYYEQNSAEVRRCFLEKLPHYKKRANELGIKVEVGSMEFAARNSYIAKKIINSIISKRFPSALPFPLKKRKGICVVPWIGQLQITQDGNVRLCCSSICSLGNINNITLGEAWNSEMMKKIRRSFKEGKFPRTCGYCRGMNFTEYPSNSFKDIPRTKIENISNDDLVTSGAFIQAVKK